jgi:hypothetical protein
LLFSLPDNAAAMHMVPTLGRMMTEVIPEGKAAFKAAGGAIARTRRRSAGWMPGSQHNNLKSKQCPSVTCKRTATTCSISHSKGVCSSQDLTLMPSLACTPVTNSRYFPLVPQLCSQC